MMQTHLPLTRDLVLIGGGHSHALLLRIWGMNPLAGVRVTVINPGPTAPYSGMLPGFVAGHYSREDLDIDLVKLARFAGARVVLGAATGVDRERRLVHVPNRPPIAYDVLSVDVGITSTMPDLKGFPEHGIPAKPLGAFASKWDAFRNTAASPEIAVIGGGVAGAELAMAMKHAAKGDAKVRLIDRGLVLKDLGEAARAKVLKALKNGGVELVENAEVSEVTSAGVLLADGRIIAAQFVTGAAGARPHGWMSDIGVEMTSGFIAVNRQLQSSDPAIFAVGDCAHMTANPRPKAGVYAVRQAPVLFRNLRAVLSGGALQTYTPQKDYLKLISLGKKSALAEKLDRAFSGPLLWRLKNHIDVKFMNQFNSLPKMATPALPHIIAEGVVEAIGDKPMCGGCGAKVGRKALRSVLTDLPASDRADVHSVAGDDAAILTTGGVTQIMTTDHLRSFFADPVVMSRIAAIHALGDVWAMGAAPQAVTANLILPRTSADLQARTLTEIMQSAQEVISEAGAEIVGGHSSLGDELTIGFTVTGLCDRAPITIAGAKAGDVLILTKPIGSGVIMAAEMAGEASGDIVAKALETMMIEQGKASEILHDAHAMTDVTGFGLAGHLSVICEASGVAATLEIDAIPFMDGAVELAAGGTKSSLFKDNRSGAGPVFGADGPRGDLLFDPQTAGGLLAAVDAAQAEAVLAALIAAGYPAKRIGFIAVGEPVVKVI